MALPAVLPEPVLMGVLVTICAVVELLAGKLLEGSPVLFGYGMAFDTFNSLMHPDEGKFRIGMIEFNGRLKGILGVAVCTSG